MDQTLKNDKKPKFGPTVFVFFLRVLPLDIVPRYHTIQFKGELVNQT